MLQGTALAVHVHYRSCRWCLLVTKNEILPSSGGCAPLQDVCTRILHQGRRGEGAGSLPTSLVEYGSYLVFSLPWIIQREALAESWLRSPQPQLSPRDTLTHFTQGEKPRQEAEAEPLCVLPPSPSTLSFNPFPICSGKEQKIKAKHCSAEQYF